MDNLQALSASEAARRIAEGDLSPVQLVEVCLEQIAQYDSDLNAWCLVDADGARAVAQEREREARSARLRGPLHGVPVAIKDIIDVAGMMTANGAAAFAHRHPGTDALCVARLRAAGAIILGKVATTEFAYFEPAATRNPWNLGHTPGGSSSGSAAAVAARMAPLALGTQTVGSVLRPAAFCGIVGFKGSYGAVPVDGSSPLARSLDHIGVFARQVGDARLAFATLAGRTLARGPNSAPRIAIAPDLIERAEPDTAMHIRHAVEQFKQAGAQVREIALPASFSQIHEAGRIILEREFATYQQELYGTHAANYRPRTRGLIEAGLAQNANAYGEAQHLRALFRDEMMGLLQSNGILLCPTAFGTAPKGLEATGDPWFCAPWTSIGAPALSLPIAIGAEGLPLAIQLVGPLESDAGLLDCAEWCEAILAFNDGPRRYARP